MGLFDAIEKPAPTTPAAPTEAQIQALARQRYVDDFHDTMVSAAASGDHILRAPWALLTPAARELHIAKVRAEVEAASKTPADYKAEEKAAADAANAKVAEAKAVVDTIKRNIMRAKVDAAQTAYALEPRGKKKGRR